MFKLLSPPLLFLLVGFALPAHADPIVYDFYLVRQGFGPGEVPYFISETMFSLTDGQTPDQVIYDSPLPTSNPQDYYLNYFNVDGFGEVVFNSGEADLGIDLYDCPLSSGPCIPQHVDAGPLWTGDPYHPTFLPGIYYSFLQIPDYIEIVAEPTPEPATFIMLGTGIISALGLMRRRNL